MLVEGINSFNKENQYLYDGILMAKKIGAKKFSAPVNNNLI